MEKVTWYDHNIQNDQGITSYAIRESDDYGFLWGYNGIVKGDTVIYEGEEWTVVMVSRLGDFGLSQTGELPYTTRVNPNKVMKKADGTGLGE